MCSKTRINTEIRLCAVKLGVSTKLRSLSFFLLVSLIHRTEQYPEYDSFITCTDPSNPWITDDVSFWEQENSL